MITIRLEAEEAIVEALWDLFIQDEQFGRLLIFFFNSI